MLKNKIKLLLLLGMLFLHIVDDYYLQGILASMKQRKWWEKNAPDELYKNDYIIALIEHAFSWTFMIMFIPALYLYSIDNDGILFSIIFVINWLIHSVVDNTKANKLKINLIQDQAIHIIQVVLTWLALIIFY